MMDMHSRRAFLRAAMTAGVAWAAADLAQVEDALAWAAQRPATGQPQASALTSAQAATVEALVARIIPAVDGRPGAREVGAARFIERALATFNAGQRRAYADGLADLDRRAAAAEPGAAGFAVLQPARQDDLLRQIEQTPFFQMVRFDTIVGTFALPTYGGNDAHAGWHMIGFEHQPRFQPPFGYYDAQAGRG